MPPAVTVVIPSHNRQSGVLAALGVLLDEKGMLDFEVVVVDDGSTPPLSLVRDGIRLIRTPGVERSRARNQGALAATGALLIFMDDDIGAPPAFVRAHAQAAKEFDGAMCVGGIVLPPGSAQTPFGRFRRLIEDPTLVQPRGLVKENNFCTAQNMSIGRERFLALGGFDPAILSGEDQDLALRHSSHGGSIAFLPEATAIHHDSAMDIASYCRRHEWGARAIAPFLRRYPYRSENRQRLRFDPRSVEASSPAQLVAFSTRLILSKRLPLRAVLASALAMERAGATDSVLFPMYKAALGLHLFKGFRAGLAETLNPPSLPVANHPAI